jgi:hypothetical protein
MTGQNASAREGQINQDGSLRMAEHEHGSMDIREQEKTFAGFMRAAAWVAAVSIGILIFLALVNS